MFSRLNIPCSVEGQEGETGQHVKAKKVTDPIESLKQDRNLLLSCMHLYVPRCARGRVRFRCHKKKAMGITAVHQ
jgi:hypothetical protein